MKLKLNLRKYPTANNKNKYKMKQLYYFKHLLFGLCLLASSLSLNAQTTYDWDNAAPDGNFKQGAAGTRWNPGGLWDEPPYGIVQFNNNNQTTMTNNVAGTWSQFKINFGASATSARTIGGNTIELFDFGGTWPFIRNQSSATHVINFPLKAGTGGTFNLELIASNGNLNFGGTIDNQGKGIYIYGNNAAVDGTNRAIRLGGVLSGSGLLNVSQFGVVKLNATHTYTGQTQIDNGELWIESAGSIASGSGIFVGNGGQLANVTKFWISNASGGSTVTNNITINNGNANTRYLGGLNTSGAHVFSGNITNNSTTGGLNLSALNSGGSVVFSGVISGSSNLISEGAGTVSLSGANTYTGTTTVNAGTLQMNATNTLPSTTAVTTANVAGATWSLNGFNQSVVSLAGGGATGGNVSLGSATLSITGSTNTTFAGDITGTGGITKTGSGILTLTAPGGTIAYTGTTTITAGQIRVNPAGFSGMTLGTSVNLNGGTLSSTGISTFQGAVFNTLNLSASSTIALGSNVHTLTFAASNGVSWTSPATLIVTGWTGGYNGTTGTAGQIVVGSSATGLTASQLGQILFFNGTNYYSATILATGEVVPKANIAMFWNGTGTWSAANTWGLVSGGPYNQTWTSGRGAIFNVAASTIIGATTNFAYITANENVTVTASGTLGTGGTVAPIYVASGKLFNFQAQAISVAAGTGFIKNGSGTLQLAGAAWPAGFTLNDGMLAAGGNNAMGGAAGNTLTINGGTIGLTATRDFTGKFPAGITINGDFTLGSGTAPSVAASNATFTNNTALGSSVTRTITLGGTGTYVWNGIISGTSSNLTIAATAAGVLSLGGVNTYGGNTTINGGTVRLTTGADRLPTSTGLIFANTAGAVLDLNGQAQTVASISGGGSTGGNVTLGAGTLTINQTSNTTYSGLISGTGAVVKTGAGRVILGHTANTYTGTTTITAGEIRLNPSTTTGSFASQIVLNGGKLSTTGITASTVFTSSSTLNLNANSSIDLGSNAHDLKFADCSAVTWAGTTLTINGWTGTGGASGTAGRIFFGAGLGTLTGTQLGKIVFTGYPGTPILLGTGELVPAVAGVNYTWNGVTSSAWGTGTNWTPNGIPGASDNVTIPDVASYTNALVVTGSQACYDFTVNADGTYSVGAAATLTVGGAYVYSSSTAATFNCTSTLALSGTASITVPAANYGNLDLTGGARVLASSGTIGICGTFTRGAGAYTVTGSTVDYNGTGAQTIAAGTYNNLTISNARGAANLTSPAGTIAVAGTFDVSTLSAYTPVVNAASIFDFTSASAQGIPAFFYGQLNNTGNGNRTWASSGIIDINQNLTPGSGTHTVTGSTVRFSATSGTRTIPVFNSSATPRHYNNLIINGAGGTFAANVATFGVAGNVDVTAGTFIVVNGTATTMHIDGTLTINGGTFNINAAAVGANLNLYGDFTMSSGGFVKTGGGTSVVNFIKASGTQNISQSGGTITNAGAGTTTWNIGNASTTNTVTLTSNFALAATSMVVLNQATLNFANFTLSGAYNFTTNTGGTLSFGATGLLSNTGTFGLSTGANLITAHIAGIAATGSATGCVQSSGTRTYNVAANYTYNAATDGITGTGLTGAATLKIATTSGARITLSKPTGTSVTVTTTVDLTSGILITNTCDLYLSNAATFTGGPWSTSNMVASIGSARYAGGGRVLKHLPNGPQAGFTFTFPLGDITGTVEYSPVNITNLTYTAATSPYIAFKVKDAQHPNDATFNNYLSRYWETLASFPSGSGISMTATFQYVPADIVGTEALIKMNRYDITTGAWTEDAGSSCSSNLMTSVTLAGAGSGNFAFDDDDMVGRLDVPIYFRSAASGVFEVASNWIVSTDPTFTAPTGVTASTYPIYSNSAGIRIMNTHNMSVAVGSALDDATIDAGGTLTYGPGSTNFIFPGAGTDLTVNGTLTNSSGTITVIGSIDFGATGLYNHNISGNLVPLATWAVGSECRITGPMASAPGNLGQAFSDFTWNAPGQTISLSLASGLTNVGRDLNIVNTNSFTLGLTATTALSLSLGRDLNISSGFLTLVTGANANAVSMAVTGNVNITGGGFSVAGGSSSGAGATSLTVGGTFNNSSSSGTSFVLNGGTKTGVTGTLTGLYTHSGTGTASLGQAASGSSTLNCNGGITISSGTFNVANGGPSTLTISAGNTLTLNGGTLNGSLTAHTSTINANGTVNVSLGTLTMATLGTSTFNLNDAYDFNLTGGTVNIAAGGTGNLNIGSTTAASNTFNLNGGTINVASGGTGNLNLYNDLDLTSGNINRSSGTATVHFRGIGASLASVHTQTFTQSAATITGLMNFTNTFGSFTSVVFGTNVDIGAAATLTANSNNSFFDFANFVLTGNAFLQNATANIATANADGFSAAGALGSVQTSTRTFSASGSFVYSGTSAQVTGSGAASAFTISAFNPAGVTLSQSTSIAGFGGGAFLNFNGYNGKLYLGNFDLTLTASATVVNTPFSSSYYIVTNGTGKLFQTVGATDVSYMIGNSAYNPITLRNTGASDAYGVRVIDAVTSPAPNDATKLINRYWDITENVAGGSTLAANDLTPSYNSGEENANFAAGTTLKMGYHNGAGWTEVTATSSGAGPFTIDNNATISPAVANYTIGIGKDDAFLNPSTTYTWNGSVNSSWTNPANWTPGTSAPGVGPTLTDNAIINVPGGTSLDITGSRGINDLDLSGTGTFNIASGASLNIAGNFTYTSSATPTFDCASTLSISSTSSQTIPAFDYGSLNASGGNRVLASSGTIGICGTFTPGVGAYTITGSTVNYNGTGAQTIAAINYNNLSISNNRGGANITLAAGTIDVAGTFNPSLTSYVGVVTGNTVNFSGSAGQGIPAFTYNNITSSNLARTWASSGVIDVNGTFAIPSSATQTVTGSTVRYSSTAAGTVSLASFTSSAAPRHYNNLEIVGGASSIWNLASGFNMGCAGDFSLTGAGTFNVAVNATANTMTVNGNLTLSGAGNIIIANTATATLVNSITVNGNTTISNGLLTCVGSASSTTVQGNLSTTDLTISGTGAMNLDAASNTANATVTVNGNMSVTSSTANAVNFGSGTANASNVINLKGNFAKSGSGTLGFSGTFNATSGYFFNLGSGTQTFSHSGAAMTGGNFTVSAGSTLQLLTNLTLGTNASATAVNIAGVLDAGLFAVAAGNAANTFALNATGTIRTTSTTGIAGTVTGFTPAPSFASGGTFEFNGTAVNTGFSTFTGITTSNQYTITWTGNTSLTLDKTVDLTAFNFTNSGLVILGNFNISIPSSAGALTGAGFGVSKMFVTNGTGILSRAVLSGGTGLPFTWPIGENTGTTEYSPVTVTSIAGAGINGAIGFRVVDGVQPSIAPAVSYLSRYWPCTVTGFNVGYSLSGLTFTYDAATDIVVGPEASLKGNIYNSTGSYWTELATSSAAASVLTITSGISGSFMPTNGTYDITGRIDVPTYYQSVATGSWSTASNWEIADNLSFTGAVVASTPPNNLNNAGIFIRSGSPISVSSAVTADQLTVDAGATLTVAAGGSLTIANGTGTDLSVAATGTLLTNAATATFVVNASATALIDGTFREATGVPTVTVTGSITIGATGTYEHSVNAGTIPTCTWSSGATCKLLNMTATQPSGLTQAFHHFTVDCPTLGGAGLQFSGNLTNVGGNLTIVATGAGFVRLSTGAASYTLNVGGNIDVQSGELDFTSGGTSAVTATVNVTGNLIQSAGTIRKTGAQNLALTITGDFTQNGGTFDFSTVGSTTSTVTLRGNFLENGTVQRGGGTAIFNFHKASGTQTWSQGTPITTAQATQWNIGTGVTTNTVQFLTDINIGTSGSNTFTVNNAATLDFQDKVLLGTNTPFTMGATATLKIGSQYGITTAAAGATAGNLQTQVAGRVVQATGTYIYHGTVNQVTGNLLPTTLTGTGKLTISNTGAALNNTVTLTTNNTTTPQLNLTSGLFAIGSGQTLIISSLGTVNQSGTGDFAVGATGGMVRFSANGGSFTGTCNPFSVETNGANCGVNFGAGTVTIQSGGVFNINTGGFVSTNAPAYASGSSLWYLTGGTYGRGLEWSTISGKGYPHHVVVAGATTLNPASTAAVNAAVPFRCGGNLTINSGANIYMNNGGNNMTVPLIVNGNINLVGNLSGSGAIGGDIELKGNWNNNGVAVVNFFPNNRAVTFNGTSNQNIGGSNTTVNPFAYLTINNAAGVTLTTINVEVNNQLNLTSGTVTLGNFNLKLNGLNTPLVGGTSTNYIITNGTGAFSRNFDNVATLYPVGPNGSTYSPVTLQQSGTADDITVRVNTAPAFFSAVNDNNQMVNLEWKINESVAGGNNLSSNFQWPLSSEAAGFIRANGVFQGDYTGAAWQVRASTLSGGNPYLSSSSVNFTGNLSNRPFVVGNINGIIGCVATIASGTWTNPLTWAGGVIPPTASTACIGHAVQITGANTNALTSVTLTAGGTLDIDATRSLVFGTGGLLTNSTGALSTITGGGSILFNTAGTIAGGNAITLNNVELNGLTTISTPLTVNGDLILNTGSSVSATPTYGSSSNLIYKIGGSYNVNVEWTGNSNVAGFGVPSSVNIRNNTTLNMPSSDRGQAGTMNIESGTLNMGTGDLYVNGDWTRDGTNGFFNPNGKAIFFNRAGTQILTVLGGGTETFNYLVLDKTAGSLVLNSADVTNITVNGSSGNALQIINTGSLDLNGNSLNLTNAGGSILTSGGVRNIISTLPNGQVNVQASKSVSSALGGSLVFGSNVKVALSAGMDFGNTISTIQGTLQIALGGFVNTNAPTYDIGSTLRYFSGSAYGRGTEWSATSGPGYPYHVTIDQNGTVTTLDLSNGGSALRQMAGNLTLNDGGNLSMGAMTNPLVVKGNVSIGGASSGSLSLSSAAGGDIQIAGNLTRNAGGTFTQNGREITMNGTAIQNISNNISSFDYLNIDNTGSSVQINSNTTVNTRLKLTNGLYDLNGFTNTMANGSQIRRSAATATMSTAPTINGGTVVDMRYDATMTSGVEFIQDVSKIRDLEITLGTLTINQDKIINRDLILSGGDLDLATFTFTDRGNAVAPSFAGSITVSGGGVRLIVGSLGSRFDITGLGGNSPLLYTKTVSTFGGTQLSFDSNVLVRIGDGAVDFGAGSPTTVNGVLQVMLGGSVGQILNPCYYGTNSILRFANTVDYQVGLNDKTWASGAIGSGNPGIPWNVEVNDIGTDLQLQNTRALRGNLTITNGTFTLTPAYTGTFAIGGNWTRTGAASSFSHNNKKVVFDKQIVGDQSITVGGGITAETYYDLDFSPVTGNVILNGNVNALNAVGLVTGKVDLNGNTFTLGTTGVNGTLTGGSANEYFISGTTSAKLIRYTTTTATLFAFPVGDATNYTPLDLTFNVGGVLAGNSQITVNIIPNAHPNLGTSTNYLSRYWTVNPTNVPVNTVYGVNYSYADADIVGVEAFLFPAKHDAGGWIQSYGSGAVYMMGSGSVNPGTNTVSWSGLYSFSDFTGNGNGSPLPISLIDFNAQPVLEQVAVTWTTASEINNDYFTIERSIDGINFRPLTEVDGAGNSNTILNYKLMDSEPFDGVSYYRLKQTDFDGKFEYSEVKAVNFQKPTAGQNWSVYPNPSNLNGINLSTGVVNSELIDLKLTDVTGKLVYSEQIGVNNKGDNKFISFENVNTGIYYLTIIDGDQAKTIKVVLTSK
jgi:autotransporter-associated beta strand protein